ncbi:MAG: hypothetical protein WAK48_09060 [Candidatus Acidiferrum sp.]
MEDLNLVVLMIDGIQFGGQALVVALGIAESGEKHVLGVCAILPSTLASLGTPCGVGSGVPHRSGEKLWALPAEEFAHKHFRLPPWGAERYVSYMLWEICRSWLIASNAIPLLAL